MTLFNHAKDISLSPALQRDANTLLQTTQPVPSQKYGCPECGHLSQSVDSLKEHMQTHRTTQDVICKICRRKYKTVKSLRRHEETHNKIEAAEVKERKLPNLPCPQCPKKFITRTALHWHVERNHAGKEKTNTCHVCGKELSDHALLKRHLETVHSLETATCSICSKTFKSVVNLQRHVAVTHPPENAEKTCDICKKTFKCSTHLRIHVRTVHSANTVFNCDKCHKEFASKAYMLKHRKTHVDVKEFQCEICYQVYKSITDARRHAKRVHMKTEGSKKIKDYKCEICDKQFTRTKYLFFHKKTHVDKTISCEFCSKLFKCTSHINKHTKRMHSNTLVERKPEAYFYCDICKKSFNKKKILAKHMKIHIITTKELPCDICEKLFKTNSDVNRHLKRVHMKNMNIKDMIMKNINIRNNNINASTKTDTEEILATEDAPINIEFRDNVSSNTNYNVTTLEIAGYADEIPRSEDYKLATLRNAEYIVEKLQSNAHTLEIPATTERIETLENSEFMEQALTSKDFVREVSRSAQFTDEALRSVEFTEDVLENNDHAVKDLENNVCLENIRSLNFIKDPYRNADFTEEIIRREDLTKEPPAQIVEAYESTVFIKHLESGEYENVVIDDPQIKCKSHGIDIIKVAIENSDFTMEDLGMTEITQAPILSAEETRESTNLIAKIIECRDAPDNTEFKQKLRNTDIIKAAIEISDFTIEDLEVANTEDGVEDTETREKAINSTVITDAFKDMKTAETLARTDFIEVLGNTRSTASSDKAIRNSDIIKDAIDSSNFTLEDLEMTEFTENALETTDYTIDFGIAECTNTLATIKYADESLASADFIEEALISTEYVKEDSGNPEFAKKTSTSTDFIEDALSPEYAKEASTEFTDYVLGGSEFTEQALENTFFIDILGNTNAKNVRAATKFTGKSLGDTYLMEEEVLESTVTEKTFRTNLTEHEGESIEYSKEISESQFANETFRNTDVIKGLVSPDFAIKEHSLTGDNLENSVTGIGIPECNEVDLKSIEIKLLKCLKCGIDFDNDVDLHTHLCGGEMSLFLDFQEM